MQRSINDQIRDYERAYVAAMALWRYHGDYLAGLLAKGHDIKYLEEYQKYLIVARDLHVINQHLERLRDWR